MILNRIRHKVKSRRGSSLLYALLIMMTCVVIVSVVITAGTVAAGRIATSIENEQRYYAVNSAVSLLEDIIGGQEITIAQTKTTQTVSFYTIKVDSNGNLVNLESDTTKNPVYKEEFSLSKAKITTGTDTNQTTVLDTDYLTKHVFTNNGTAFAENDVTAFDNYIDGLGYMSSTEYAVLKVGSRTVADENIANFYSRSSDMLLDSALDYTLGSARTAIQLTTFTKLQEYLASVWNSTPDNSATQSTESVFTMEVEVGTLKSGSAVDVKTEAVTVTVKCVTSGDNATFTVTSGDGDVKDNYTVKLVYHMSVTSNDDSGGKNSVDTDEQGGNSQLYATETASAGGTVYVYRQPFTRTVVETHTTTIRYELVSTDSVMQQEKGGTSN